MTTKEFLEKYPMVLEADVIKLTSTTSLQMMKQMTDYYEGIEEDPFEDEYSNDEEDTYYEEEQYLPDLTYVVASTSYEAEETFVFPANEDGTITSFNEITGIAKRWGNENWMKPAVAMAALPNHEFVKQIADNRVLYKYKPNN